MKKLTRREVLKATAGAAAATLVGTSAEGLGIPSARAAEKAMFKPEKGARLRVLRWKQFVSGDHKLWMENTAKFSKRYGVPVHVDWVSFEDVRPKAAVAANVGAGPDIVYGWYDDPELYPDKLHRLTELADYLGEKYGGWYPVCKTYGRLGDDWIGLPLGCAGNAVVYRQSWMHEAGFEEFPKHTDGFLKLAKALSAKGHPPGLALGHATGDANAWTHWVVWAHGGKMVDEHNNVVINSPETVAALEYARELYQTFIPGTLAWLDGNNNRAFLASRIGMTINGISIYYVAKKSKDPAMQALARDIYHGYIPIGPVGHPTELNLFTQAMLFKYSKYPRAAQEYLRFMMEAPQYEAWQQASLGYVTQPLKAYASNPIWTADPKNTPYRDAMERMLYNGYAGKLGYASAGVMANWVVVDMVAQAASGQKTPKQAAADAARRAERYYKYKG